MADTAIANTDKKKNASGTPKKPNIFKRMWSKLKETFSELKKVIWPGFGKTAKQTAVVLVVVLVFLVVIGLFDFGLTQLYNLIT